MKRILFLAAFVLFVPAVLPAQTDYRYAGREGKIMAFGDFLSGLFAKEAVKHAKTADDRAQARKENDRASSAFKALMSAYPEYAASLSKVADGHRSVVRILSEQKDEKNAAQNIGRQFEYLYGAMVNVRRADAEVAAQALQILRHEYWLDCAGELLSFEGLKEWVYGRLVSRSPALSRNVPSWYHAL